MPDTERGGREEYRLPNPKHVQVTMDDMPGMLFLRRCVDEYKRIHGEWPKKAVVHPACPLGNVTFVSLYPGIPVEVEVDLAISLTSLVLCG